MEDFPPPPGAAPVVPGYDVGRWLGRGASATVWLATEKSTGRDVAVKCFPPGGGSGGQELSPEADMRREVRILSALDHDHLVRAHAVVRLEPAQKPSLKPGAGEPSQKPGADGGLGLVLDYAPGGSLGALVAGRGQLGAGETVTVLTPIAQALAYLHAQGFTHGDIAPGNVLFTAHGKPLLADLGVARMVADPSTTAEHGTDGFRDPAPVDAVRAGLQPERDVYSLAALGWYCLSGRAPEPGDRRPPLPLLVPGVPAALAAALEAGLREDRRLRPTAAELATAVYRSATAEPIDLSGSVHPTVIPDLLTRRALPRTPGEAGAARLRRWFGDVSRRIRRGPAPARVPARKAAGPVPADAVPARVPARKAAVPEPAPPRRAARHAAGPGRSAPRRSAPRNGAPRRSAPRNGAPGNGLLVASVALSLVVALTGAWLLGGTGLPSPFTTAQRSASGPGAQPEPERTVGHSAPGSAAELAGPDSAATATVPQDIKALLSSEDPVEAVHGLSRLRSLAFNSGDMRLLDQVNAPGSSAAAADGRIGARLGRSGHVLTGYANVLTAVERSADSGPWRTVVDVSVAPSAYQERDARGTLVAEAGAGGEQRLRLVLVPVDGRWRIQEILPGSIPPG